MLRKLFKFNFTRTVSLYEDTMSCSTPSLGGSVPSLDQSGPHDIDLEVTLPNGRVVTTTVNSDKHVMDVLINMTTKHGLSPSDYVFGADGRSLDYLPSQTIGSLGHTSLVLMNKKRALHVDRENRSRKNANFEITKRVVVHLPHNHRHLLRINGRTPLGQVMLAVCHDKNLDPNKFRLKHFTDGGKLLNMADTVESYGLSDIIMQPKENDIHSSVTSLTSLDTMEKQKKKGFFSRFSKKKENAKSLTDQYDTLDASSSSRLSAPPKPPRSNKRSAPAPPPGSELHDLEESFLSTPRSGYTDSIPSSPRDQMNNMVTKSNLELKKKPSKKKRPAPPPPPNVKPFRPEESQDSHTTVATIETAKTVTDKVAVDTDPISERPDPVFDPPPPPTSSPPEITPPESPLLSPSHISEPVEVRHVETVATQVSETLGEAEGGEETEPTQEIDTSLLQGAAPGTLKGSTQIVVQTHTTNVKTAQGSPGVYSASQASPGASSKDQSSLSSREATQISPVSQDASSAAGQTSQETTDPLDDTLSSDGFLRLQSPSCSSPINDDMMYSQDSGLGSLRREKAEYHDQMSVDSLDMLQGQDEAPRAEAGEITDEILFDSHEVVYVSPTTEKEVFVNHSPRFGGSGMVKDETELQNKKTETYKEPEVIVQSETVKIESTQSERPKEKTKEVHGILKHSSKYSDTKEEKPEVKTEVESTLTSKVADETKISVAVKEQSGNMAKPVENEVRGKKKVKRITSSEELSQVLASSTPAKEEQPQKRSFFVGIENGNTSQGSTTGRKSNSQSVKSLRDAYSNRHSVAATTAFDIAVNHREAQAADTVRHHGETRSFGGTSRQQEARGFGDDRDTHQNSPTEMHNHSPRDNQQQISPREISKNLTKSGLYGPRPYSQRYTSEPSVQDVRTALAMQDIARPHSPQDSRLTKTVESYSHGRPYSPVDKRPISPVDKPKPTPGDKLPREDRDSPTSPIHVQMEDLQHQFSRWRYQLRENQNKLAEASHEEPQKAKHEEQQKVNREPAQEDDGISHLRSARIVREVRNRSKKRTMSAQSCDSLEDQPHEETKQANRLERDAKPVNSVLDKESKPENLEKEARPSILSKGTRANSTIFTGSSQTLNTKSSTLNKEMTPRASSTLNKDSSSRVSTYLDNLPSTNRWNESPSNTTIFKGNGSVIHKPRPRSIHSAVHEKIALRHSVEAGPHSGEEEPKPAIVKPKVVQNDTYKLPAQNFRSSAANETKTLPHSSVVPPPPVAPPPPAFQLASPQTKNVLPVKSGMTFGKRLPEPSLDPREELMIAIRNFGGRGHLRKVPAAQTKRLQPPPVH